MSLVTLSQLSWSTPEGHSLFSGINLSFGHERVGVVGTNGVGKTTLLQLISREIQPTTGCVSVSGRLGILQQTVQVSQQKTVADLFGVTAELEVLRRAEAGEANAEELADADWMLEERIAGALGRVGLNVSPQVHLSQLSGGQRTRVQLAAVLFREPDILLLDEPTNNLDREGRAAVIRLVTHWRSAAIIVSHDRELLDQMDAIVELTSLGAARYGGNWSHYREQKIIERQAAEHALSHAERHAAEINRKAQLTIERKQRRDAAGARKNARGDLPRLHLGARKSNAQLSQGACVRLAERQRTEALKAVATTSARVEIQQELSVTLTPTGLPASRLILNLENVTAGYESDRPVLRDLSLSMRGPERVAVTGLNGSGKSTLLNVITGRLAAFHGRMSVSAQFALLDQTVSFLDQATSIVENFLRLNPTSNVNQCRWALANFLFPAATALQRVGTLSGGQMLRAGLACTLGGPEPPCLLILDEPTNHLDLDSIQAVERGLAAYDGALLVVSHDETFLQNIGVHRRLELVDGAP